MVERREFRRHRVGGNVEITSVLGTGTAPQERATLLDCSLGGARVRVLSPRRRLFKTVAPCLTPHDSLTCILRLAPDYDAIDVFAEVVRVERATDEPDYIDVGVRFFHDAGRRSHSEKPMARLARIIEPDWSAEQAAIAAAAVEAAAARPRPASPATPPAAQQPDAPANRSARHQGQRLGRQADPSPSSGSQKADRAVSARQPASPAEAPRASQRLERAASARLRPEQPAARDAQRASRRAARISARQERRATSEETSPVRVSGRLAGARLDPERTTPPRAPSSDSEVVAWASSRLTAAAPPQERVATADDEVTVRGSARLAEGKAVIELPGAFTALAREAGLTAHVTPTAECAGLFVAERSPARLVVRELGGGKSAATFDYLVIATRRA